MQQSRKVLKGEPVSLGIAIAKVYIYEPLEFSTCNVPFAKGMEREYIKEFQDTVKKAKAELKEIYDELALESEENAQIFMSHQVMLEDECVLQEIRKAIEKERMYPDAAIAMVFARFAEQLKAVPNSMITERIKDLQDVERRLIRIWQDKKEHNLCDITEDVIVVAHDLLPSDIAMMNSERVKGIITEIGGETSHCAILAKCYGIPAVLGVREASKKLMDGMPLAMDALNGEVIYLPTEEDLCLYEKKKQRFLIKYENEKQYLDQPVETKDGVSISIGINLGTEQVDAKEDWFDYVGILRTEFLYMDRNALPTEEEQLEVYKGILEQIGNKWITIRTLDIGGDKLLPYLAMPKEENPFLGMRGIRFCFRYPEIFMEHLRALLRASVYGKMRIMFPMVESMDDIYLAKSYVYKAMEELDRAGIDYDRDVQIGVMIETPALAMIADLVADEVDFASIGSNDLVQYFCAADRSNVGMADYYQSYSPAMLRMMGYIFETFEKKGKYIGICGELASSPKGACLCVGLGARWISMEVSSIPSVKAALSNVTLQEMKKHAQICKNLRTEQEVKAFMGFPKDGYLA